MLEPPAISVLMPVYNAAATLARAVRSVLGQTERGFELVVVDDGSTDGSAELLAGLAWEDPRVRPLFAPHRGVVSALEQGLAACRGALVARMDADDEMLPGRLAAQRALLERRPELGVVGCLVRHPAPEDPHREGYARHVAWLNTVVTPEEIERARFVESPFAHPSVMFHRALVQQHGSYRDGPFPEDYELWLRWLEAGVKMAKVPEPLLIWHDDPQRLSRTDARYSVEAFYRLKASYLAAWLARHNPHHPELVVWGSGKLSRQRAAWLEAAGCRIVAYVDVDPRRVVSHQTPIWYYQTLTRPEQGFVVSYVSRRDAHAVIQGHLSHHGWIEGVHYLLAA